MKYSVGDRCKCFSVTTAETWWKKQEVEAFDFSVLTSALIHSLHSKRPLERVVYMSVQEGF